MRRKPEKIEKNLSTRVMIVLDKKNDWISVKEIAKIIDVPPKKVTDVSNTHLKSQGFLEVNHKKIGEGAGSNTFYRITQNSRKRLYFRAKYGDKF